MGMADKIRERRAELHWSRAELAGRSGVAARTLDRLEDQNHRADPRISIVAAVAVTLGLPLDTLLEERPSDDDDLAAAMLVDPHLGPSARRLLGDLHDLARLDMTLAEDIARRAAADLSRRSG
jgi:transcriptional regulator with XRE-family HTH domain